MLEFFSDPKVAEQIGYLVKHVPFAVWETLYTTVVASVFAYLIGLPLGVLLVVGARDGMRPLPPPLMQAVNTVINLLRSMPFLILMVLVMPLSRFIMGTSIGTVGVLVPLSVAAASLVAWLVESSLREMDRGVLEAAQAMGCSTLQVVWKVLLPESLPSLLSGFTTAFVTILGYGAMSGFIGGGGLGSMSLQYAWNNRKMVVLYGAVIVLVILVQIFQSAGSHLAVRMDRRVTNRRGARKKQGEREKEIPPGAV